MPYATGRTFLDADSHIMELPGFLREHADPTIRDRMPEVSPSSGGRMADAVERLGPDGGHSPERVADLLDLGDGLIAGPKGYEALGACNAVERGRALDLLGFHRQLVFATFSPGVLFDPNGPPDVTAAAASAHNRAMAMFCSSDERLLGVGATALDDVQHRHGRARTHHRPGSRRSLDPAPASRGALARPRRPRPLLGCAGRQRPARCPPRRRGAAATPTRMARHEAAPSHRLAGGR